MGPYELLQRIVEVLDRLDIPYLVTGSVAAMAYGEPRLTNDIDIVAAIEERHIAGFMEAFPPDEFYVSEEAIREAIRRRLQFNVIHPSSGLKIDIILRKGTPFDVSRFSRLRRIKPAESYAANFAEQVWSASGVSGALLLVSWCLGGGFSRSSTTNRVETNLRRM